jgi:steroid Delta-isomerase
VNATIIPAVVDEYAAAINHLDTDAYVATFAGDAIAYEPVGAPPYQGSAGIRQFFESTGGLFANLNIQWTFVQIVGNEVAIKWTADGVGKNGRSVTFEGIDLWTLNDVGKIQSLRAYWNPEPVVAQLS